MKNINLILQQESVLCDSCQTLRRLIGESIIDLLSRSDDGKFVFDDDGAAPWAGVIEDSEGGVFSERIDAVVKASDKSFSVAADGGLYPSTRLDIFELLDLWRAMQRETQPLGKDGVRYAYGLVDDTPESATETYSACDAYSDGLLTAKRFDRETAERHRFHLVRIMLPEKALLRGALTALGNYAMRCGNQLDYCIVTASDAAFLAQYLGTTSGALETIYLNG